MFILSSVHQDFEAIKQSLISFYTFCRGCIQLYTILEKKIQYQYQSNNTQLMSSSMLFTLYFCFKLRTSICLDLIRCILYSFLFYFYTSFLFLWLICWQYFPVLLLHPNSRLTFLTQDNDTLRRNKSFSFRWISQAVNSLFCVNHIWINRL